jgi:hypothetical protein
LAAAHNNLGVVCLRSKVYASVAKHFHEVVELEPPRPCLYHHHDEELSPDLLQSLIEPLRMVVSITPEDERHQVIRQRIKDFLDTFTFTM